MDFQNERQIADRARSMLGTQLRNRATAFKDHVNGSVNPIKDVEAVTSVRTYTKNGIAHHYLNRLSIKMGKHGFIQNFGVNTQRKGGIRKRKRPRSISYNFTSHYFKIEAKPFINESIEQSDVIPFILENVTKVRSEGFFAETRNILTRTNQ